MKNRILFFSDRVDLEEKFIAWATENNVKNCPQSVVAWLQINGLLNIEKCVEFLGDDRSLFKHTRGAK